MFGGDRLKFSGQTLQYLYYEVTTVNRSQAVLTRAFNGHDGPQQWTRRYYGGKGYPLTSRIHCKVNENLCPPEVESRSGSLQNKIEDLVQAINVGVLVDRDGPDARNGFAWQITFLDDVAPPLSYLNLSVYSNSLTTTEDSLGVPMV